MNKKEPTDLKSIKLLDEFKNQKSQYKYEK